MTIDPASTCAPVPLVYLGESMKDKAVRVDHMPIAFRTVSIAEHKLGKRPQSISPSCSWVFLIENVMIVWGPQNCSRLHGCAGVKAVVVETVIHF